MQNVSNKIPSIALLITFLAMVVLGFVVAEARYEAVQANDVDYSYFVQFSARAFDPSLAPVLSINPIADGKNMFFLAGPDGAPSLWRWIKFEPIKLIPAFIFSYNHSVLGLFIFYVVLFFLPQLYGAFLIWIKPKLGDFMALALIALAVWPSSLLYAAGNMRPLFVFPSVFICFFLSMLYRRPLAEKIAWLVFFLAIGEETLVLVAATLIWEFFRNRRDGIPTRDTAMLFGLWASWLALTVIYYIHAAYPVWLPFSGYLLFPLLLIGLCGLFGITWLLWRQGAHVWSYAPETLLLLVALLPMTFSLFAIDDPFKAALRIAYGQYGLAFFYVCTAIVVACVYGHGRAGLYRKAAGIFFSICIVLFIVSEIIPHASATREYVARWNAYRNDNALVYKAAATIPKYAPVLLDENTMTAFYAHDNAYAYNFLPYALFSGTEYTPGFPQNSAQLRTLVFTQPFSYAVFMNKDSYPPLELLKQAGRVPALIEKNDTYSWYQIR